MSEPRIQAREGDPEADHRTQPDTHGCRGDYVTLPSASLRGFRAAPSAFLAALGSITGHQRTLVGVRVAIPRTRRYGDTFSRRNARRASVEAATRVSAWAVSTGLRPSRHKNPSNPPRKARPIHHQTLTIALVGAIVHECRNSPARTPSLDTPRRMSSRHSRTRGSSSSTGPGRQARAPWSRRSPTPARDRDS